MPNTAILPMLVLFHSLLFTATAYAQRPERQHLVFFRGTRQELEVYKIQGRSDGPTAMLLGGIHGDEPGAYLSADRYADRIPLRGNLIIVPRANFQALLHDSRAPYGDMNRKFDAADPGDPDLPIVHVLKSLMAESDLLLTMHDGSGFHRPQWESDQANPNRYGQCVIVDSIRYTRPGDGVTLDLENPARAALERVNATIANPLYHFHLFNMDTASDASPHQEHRNSATYYALTRLGIPAFCIETSKDLPDMAMKIRQHDQFVNAFLDLYGIEMKNADPPPAPLFSHMVIRVGDLPLALAEGQTLHVPRGEMVEVLHAATNFERGLMVAPAGGEFQSLLHKPVRAEKAFAIEVRRDSQLLGQVHIALLPPGRDKPRIDGGRPELEDMRAAFALPGLNADPALLPGAVLLAQAEQRDQAGRTAPLAEALAELDAEDPGQVSAFRVEVDGKPVLLRPGEELPVFQGSLLTIVGMDSRDGPLPEGTVMNLKGFVPKGHELRNSGEDRGHSVNLARDMDRRFSLNRKGEIYAINAEQGPKVLASCSIRLMAPVLDSVTVRMGDEVKTLPLGSRTRIAPGTRVELLEVILRGDHALDNPRYTLAGHPLPAELPQTLTMRDIAINLAVFNGETLAGKVTWTPGP